MEVLCGTACFQNGNSCAVCVLLQRPSPRLRPVVAVRRLQCHRLWLRLAQTMHSRWVWAGMVNWAVGNSAGPGDAVVVQCLHKYHV